MNRLIKYIWFVPVLLLLISACEPQMTSAPDLDPAPVSEDVTFEYNHDGDNPNIVYFESTTEGFKFLWDMGNGQTAEGKSVTGEYPLKGEYTVQLTVFTESGQAMNNKLVTIDETNELMLDDPDLNMLTGGVDAPDGKTWVVDKTQLGHMGVGPADGTSPSWWAAGPEEKAGKGLYDDEYTFKLDGFTYEQQTNGDIYVNADYPDEFAGAVQEDGGNDFIAPFEGGSNFHFSFSKEDGKKILKINDGGHIGYYSGSRTYEIMALGENELYLRNLNHDGSVAWYQRLIPKGYERPVVVPPLDSKPLSDDFDTDGNFTWLTDQIAEFNESYDNPATFGVNTSPKVAKYVKGEGQPHEYDNIYIDLDYRLDLTQRNTFTMKVYMPSYNDYTTSLGGESWNPNPVLLKQVSVKLQDNTLGGDAYTTQEERIQQVNVTDEWVELTFDFSDVTDREDFNKIVVQIGGEAHFNPGTFFIDDFQLVE